MLVWSYLLQFQFVFGVIGIGMPTLCWTPQYWLTHVKLWLAKPTMAMLWWRAAGKWNRVINWNTSVFDTLKVILERIRVCPEGKLGMSCLPFVWNLRVAIWFHFTISCLVLLPRRVLLLIFSCPLSAVGLISWLFFPQNSSVFGQS